jgi:hypothetical protein
MRLGRLIAAAIALTSAVAALPASPARAQTSAMEFLVEQLRQRDAERRRSFESPQLRQRLQERRATRRQTEWGGRPAAPAVRPRVVRVPEVSSASPRTAARAVKNPDAARILVFGDEMAAGVATGLDQAFAAEAEVAVTAAGRPGLGLVAPGQDAIAAARELVARDPPPIAVVVALGMNDRRPIDTPAGPAEFGTERWREAYSARIDALQRVFAERRVPVYWIGLPAMRPPDAAAAASVLNDLIKARTFAASTRMIDTWEGFVDEDGRYAAIGPDVNGNPRRLREADGIGLTPAGFRKLAFYAEVEIRRDLLAAPGITRAPPQGEQPVVSTPPPAPPVGPSESAYVGRVIPLYPPPATSGAQLAEGGPTGGDGLAARALGRGEPLTPPAGRADDFRWPPREEAATPAAAPSRSSALPGPVLR